MEVQILRDIGRLMEHAGAWNELLRLNNNQNPYMTLDWISAWWRFFGGKYMFRCLMFTEERRTLGFLPLMAKRKLGIAEYRFIGTPQSSRNGFLVRPGYEKAVASEALTWFRGVGSDAVFNLRGMNRTDSSLIRILEGISGKRYLLRKEPVYSIRMEQNGLETYMQKVCRHKHIRQIINCEKSFDKILALRFVPAAPEEVELIFPIHEKRWTRKNDGNGFGKGVSRQFFTWLARDGNPDREADPVSFQTSVYLLWAGRLPIAFNYGFQCNGHFSNYRLAHDNDFGIIHPGIMVVKNIIERNFKSDLQVMDFSTGDEEYKQDWAENHDTFCQVIFGTDTPAAGMYVSAAILKNKLRQLLKRSKKLVYFKRVTLGRIKYALSGAPVRSHFKKVRAVLKLWSPGNLLCCIVKRAALKTGIFGQYRLFEIEKTHRHGPAETGPTICPAEPDRLESLSDITAMPAENIVRRYKNKERCYLVYDKNRIAGFAWINETCLGDNDRIWWKAKKPNDRCIYDLFLFKKMTADEYKELMLYLAHECSGGVKNARTYILVYRFDRKLIKAASGFTEDNNSEIHAKEALHEAASD